MIATAFFCGAACGIGVTLLMVHTHQMIRSLNREEQQCARIRSNIENNNRLVRAKW